MTYFVFIYLIAFLPFVSLLSQEISLSNNPSVNHILYLCHTGNVASALTAYENYRKASKEHHFELIEEICLVLLDQGFRQKDPDVQLMTLFGAGISGNERTLYIIEANIQQSADPKLQLIALNFLSRYHHDRIDLALKHVLSSNFLLARLEAVFQLAKNKSPKAVGLTESLMAKVPEVIWPIFPPLFAMSGTPDAKKVLRKLLTHPNEEIRVATINSIAEYDHEDFLPCIRRLALQAGLLSQESCAAALGKFRDETSRSKLKILAACGQPHIRLAALYSLYQLGDEEAEKEIERMAEGRDLFAIYLLGEIKGSKALLRELLKSKTYSVSANAAYALLKLGDPCCLPALVPILVQDTRDLGVNKTTSSSGTLSALQIIPSARQHFEEDPVLEEMSLHLREEMVFKSVELKENEFLALADMILDHNQNDLIPVLMEVMENHATPATIALLKKYQQKLGAPLVRNYCNLALYRLKEPGPYGDNIREWIKKQCNVDLIQFRPMIPWDVRERSEVDFELTASETSRLLIEAFEACVFTQDDKGIDLLISVIQNGDSKNKYALIGLLMRAIQ